MSSVICRRHSDMMGAHSRRADAPTAARTAHAKESRAPKRPSTRRARHARANHRNCSMSVVMEERLSVS